MIIIGITGQSGSGKGYLSAEFAKLGYFHADADKIYHRLLKTSDVLKGELVNEFGAGIVKDGEIDRKALGAKVFGEGNEKKLERLNKIAHKHVCNEYIHMFGEARALGAKGFIVDAPLLIEAKLHKVCDACICVECPEEMRIVRIMERDGIDRDAAMLRIASQKPIEFYKESCQYLFLNDGSQNAADFALELDRSLMEKKR